MLQMSSVLADLGRPDLAQTYLDSANSMTSQSPTTRALTARTKASILRAQGNFAASESTYQSVVRMVPDWYWDLFDLYLGTRDSAKAEATLDNWYHAVPQNWGNTMRLVDALNGQLEDRKHALEVLDSYAARNPADSQRVRLAEQRL
jgi:tetratricopeptide (TPR) repeat protein